MSSENKKKKSSLVQPRIIFYKTQWAWQCIKLTWLMSDFTYKKVWKFLIKIQLTKSDPKRMRNGKCPPSCQLGLSWFLFMNFRAILFSFSFFHSYHFAILANKLHNFALEELWYAQCRFECQRPWRWNCISLCLQQWSIEVGKITHEKLDRIQHWTWTYR